MNESFNLIFHDDSNLSSNQEFTNQDLINIYESMIPGSSEIHNIKNILPDLFYDISDVYVLVIRNLFLKESNEILPVISEYNFKKNIVFCELGYQLQNTNFYDVRTIEALNKLNILFRKITGNNIFIETMKLKNKASILKKEKIGLGVGKSFNLNFKWCHGRIVISDNYEIKINNGDVYIVSDTISNSIKDKTTKIFIKTEINR